jgi:hypothetical protein
LSVDTDERDELIREGLRMPGWYALLRTARGFERVVAVPSDTWTDEGNDSTLITLDNVAAMIERPDQLLGGRIPVVVGLFHPELYPDPEDRGTPLSE